MQTTDSFGEIPERYARQARFAPLGVEGQKKLMSGRVVLCGCGALGTVIAETLVRAGVGYLKIIDRDFVELSNLQRQVLFDEADVAAQLPKAIAAAAKLRQINSSIVIEAEVADVSHRNARELFAGADVILDGTDNFETRFLINDVSLDLGIPWVFGGCLGSHGQTMTIQPGRTACLRCVIDSPPEPGTAETCDTAGVLGSAIQVVASLQVVAAIKLLIGAGDSIPETMTILDVWEGSWRTIDLRELRNRQECPACGQGERRWLQGTSTSLTTVLCGRNAVQVTPPAGTSLDLRRLSQRWSSLGRVTSNSFLARLNPAATEFEVTVFRDGRAIIKGSDDPAIARNLYARYIGS